MMDAIVINSETVESEDLMLEKLECNDVLIEILVLLPPKSIFSLMCVSKRWRDILTESIFLRSYSAAARRRRFGSGRVLAIFQKLTNPHQLEPGKHCNTLSIPIPNRNIIEEVPRKFGYFINSSNGLILCSHENRRGMYHVINPVTKIFVSLPPPLNLYLPISTGLICEENTTKLVPIYTVVRAGLPLSPSKHKILHIDAYSSTTGVWSYPRILTAKNPFRLLNRPPLVANGLFHWYCTVWSIAVYDPSNGVNDLQLIELPLFGLSSTNTITRSSDDDLLWYGGMEIEKMKFYVLPKDEEDYTRETTIDREEWLLIYNVNLQPIPLNLEEVHLESIIPPWDHQIVAVLNDARVSYCNVQSESLERIRYYGRSSLCYEPCDNYSSPYFESYFLSSYAL